MEQGPFNHTPNALEQGLIEAAETAGGRKAVNDLLALEAEAIALKTQIENGLKIPPVKVGSEEVVVYWVDGDKNYFELMRIVESIARQATMGQKEITIEFPGLTLLAVGNARNKGLYDAGDFQRLILTTGLVKELVKRGIVAVSHDFRMVEPQELSAKPIDASVRIEILSTPGAS